MAEREREGQQLECSARDLPRRQGDWLIGEAAQVTSGVREAKAVADDGAEASADAQELTRPETVPDAGDDRDAEEANAQSNNKSG